MKTIAFFNNKGGVGKTTLVYHLAWMFSELNYRVIAVDLDSQANLSGMFLHEKRMESLWDSEKTNETKETIYSILDPLFDGIGDITTSPHIECPHVDGKIGLLVGSFTLAKLESQISIQWNECLAGDKRAFRITTAFARLIANAGKKHKADLALVDVGPNLGAINRAALISSDYVVIPLDPSLFSMYGLRSVGPILQEWREAWQERLRKKPTFMNIPKGGMEPIGYIINRFKVVDGEKPSQSHQKWINRMSEEYRRFILMNGTKESKRKIRKPLNKLAQLQNYQSLTERAQELRKPLFLLEPPDVVKWKGATQTSIKNCFNGFRHLAEEIRKRIGLKKK